MARPRNIVDNVIKTMTTTVDKSEEAVRFQIWRRTRECKGKNRTAKMAEKMIGFRKGEMRT